SRRQFTRSENSKGGRASSSRSPGILRTSRGRSNPFSTTRNGPQSCGKTTSGSERRRTGPPSQRPSCPSSGGRLSSGHGRGFLNAGRFQREAHVDGSLRTTSHGRCNLPVHRPRGGRPRTVCDPRGHDASESVSGRGGPRGLLRHGVLHARPRRGGTHPDVCRGDPRLHRRTDDPHHVVVVGAVVFLVSLANVHYPDAPSVGLALTGPDGTSNSLNRSFVLGQPKTITVTVMGNDTASSYELRIRLVPLNATGTEPFHTVSTTSPLRMDAFGESSEPIAIAVGASWTKS